MNLFTILEEKLADAIDRLRQSESNAQEVEKQWNMLWKFLYEHNGTQDDYDNLVLLARYSDDLNEIYHRDLKAVEELESAIEKCF